MKVMPPHKMDSLLDIPDLEFLFPLRKSGISILHLKTLHLTKCTVHFSVVQNPGKHNPALSLQIQLFDS